MDIGTLISLILLGLAGYHFIKHRSGPLVRYLVSLFIYQPAPHLTSEPPLNELPDRAEAFMASESKVQGTNVQAEPPEMPPPTLEELRRLVRAVEHNARGANKQQSIELAFGVKKGGSAGWRRASQLFDTAMGKE
jgi:hypothetical protein